MTIAIRAVPQSLLVSASGTKSLKHMIAVSEAREMHSLNVSKVF